MPDLSRDAQMCYTQQRTDQGTPLQRHAKQHATHQARTETDAARTGLTQRGATQEHIQRTPDVAATTALRAWRIRHTSRSRLQRSERRAGVPGCARARKPTMTVIPLTPD